MPIVRLLLLGGLVVAGGCVWPVHEHADAALSGLIAQPFDLQPEPQSEVGSKSTSKENAAVKPGPLDKQIAALPIPDAKTSSAIEGSVSASALQTPPKRGLVIPPEIPG